jgi:hypothetical protein
MTGLKLDFEVADKITLANLIESRKMIETMMWEHEHMGTWLHPDDLVYNKKLLKSLNRVIDYFGGDDEL